MKIIPKHELIDLLFNTDSVSKIVRKTEYNGVTINHRTYYAHSLVTFSKDGKIVGGGLLADDETYGEFSAKVKIHIHTVINLNV